METVLPKHSLTNAVRNTLYALQTHREHNPDTPCLACGGREHHPTCPIYVLQSLLLRHLKCEPGLIGLKSMGAITIGTPEEAPLMSEPDETADVRLPRTRQDIINDINEVLVFQEKIRDEMRKAHVALAAYRDELGPDANGQTPLGLPLDTP